MQAAGRLSTAILPVRSSLMTSVRRMSAGIPKPGESLPFGTADQGVGKFRGFVNIFGFFVISTGIAVGFIHYGHVSKGQE